MSVHIKDALVKLRERHMAVNLNFIRHAGTDEGIMVA